MAAGGPTTSKLPRAPEGLPTSGMHAHVCVCSCLRAHVCACARVCAWQPYAIHAISCRRPAGRRVRQSVTRRRNQSNAGLNAGPPRMPVATACGLPPSRRTCPCPCPPAARRSSWWTWARSWATGGNRACASGPYGGPARPSSSTPSTPHATSHRCARAHLPAFAAPPLPAGASAASTACTRVPPYAQARARAGPTAWGPWQAPNTFRIAGCDAYPPLPACMHACMQAARAGHMPPWDWGSLAQEAGALLAVIEHDSLKALVDESTLGRALQRLTCDAVD